MERRFEDSADRIRFELQRGEKEPARFRAAFLDVLPGDRDAWIDRVVGLDDIPEDGPELPRGCVPYLPCPVDALLRIVDAAPVSSDDVFIDVGAGVGRATACIHLLTGAAAIGLEVQPQLVRANRELVARLHFERVSCAEGDATKLAELAEVAAIGSVFFLYCPFSGQRLTATLAELATIARARTIRICCVDLPLPPCEWLTLENALGGDVTIYRSTFLETVGSRR